MLPTNIAIIASNALTRNGLMHIITQSTLKYHAIFSYSKLAQFLQESQNRTYRIAIIEDYPCHHQVSITRQVQTLVHEFPAMKIIVLSRLTHETYVQSILNAGAHGYLTAEDHIDTLLEDIMKTVLMGQVYLSPNLSSDMLVESLNPSDMDVLRLMYAGCNIFELGEKLDLMERSIYRIRGRLRNFLNVHTNDQILVAAYQQGWLD